ncbi:hypothetical protein AJ79_10293 [Helicocarpus griseus UAMH5409]|uniref:Uncharacterized protein n=1 Tax=Helicocarpus griseus UAMH5409 TaxID=1447875 RepID=A0A2B7WEN0_9EURO|nr:hypothetical protein AJ79_10293 [Helicocarpus griseus UAMH5409]
MTLWPMATSSQSLSMLNLEELLGKHKHAFVYKGLADCRNIIQTEVSGNGEDDRGELLVMVSASDKMRDQLRSVVRDFLHDKVTMSKLEFQPH